jgi:hypothetical protein
LFRGLVGSEMCIRDRVYPHIKDFIREHEQTSKASKKKVAKAVLASD